MQHIIPEIVFGLRWETTICSLALWSQYQVDFVPCRYNLSFATLTAPVPELNKQKKKSKKRTRPDGHLYLFDKLEHWEFCVC